MERNGAKFFADRKSSELARWFAFILSGASVVLVLVEQKCRVTIFSKIRFFSAN